MDSIAVTKPDMGTISRKGLTLSPFGALSYAFSQELLARSGFEEGRWPFVPLDLLEEREPAAFGPPVQPVVQVDLSLILQAMRRSEGRTEWEKSAERIVERIIRLRTQEHTFSMPVQTAVQGLSQVPGQGVAPQPARVPERTGSAGHSFVLKQSFYSTVNQHIRFAADIRHEAAGGRFESTAPGRTDPGGLSRRSLELSRQVCLLREGGAAPASTGGAVEALSTGGSVGALPQMKAAMPPLSAADAPKWLDGLREEHSAHAATWWDLGRMVPEKLSYLEAGKEIAFGAAAGPEITAAIYRGAQRFTQRLVQKAALQAAAHSCAGGRSADMGVFDQKAAFETMRRPYLWMQLSFGNAVSRDEITPGASFDDWYITQFIQRADWPGRRPHRSASLRPSRTARRRSEPLFAKDQRPLTDSAANQEADKQPERFSPLKSLGWTRMSGQPDVLWQRARLIPGDALAAQEGRPQPFAARDIRLTGGKSAQTTLRAMRLLSSNFPPPDLLPSGELAHRAWQEAEHAPRQPKVMAKPEGENVQGRGAASRIAPSLADRTIPGAKSQAVQTVPGHRRNRGKSAEGAAGISANLFRTSAETPSHAKQTASEPAASAAGFGLRAGGGICSSIRSLKVSMGDIHSMGGNLPDAAVETAAEAARQPEGGAPAPVSTQILPVYSARDIRTAGREQNAAGTGGRTPQALVQAEDPAGTPFMMGAELTHRGAPGEAVSPAAFQGGRRVRSSAGLQAARDVPGNGPEGEAWTGSDTQFQPPEAEKPAGGKAAPPVNGTGPAWKQTPFFPWKQMLFSTIGGIRTAGQRQNAARIGGQTPQAAGRTENPARMPWMPNTELAYRVDLEWEGTLRAAGLTAAGAGVQAAQRRQTDGQKPPQSRLGASRDWAYITTAAPGNALPNAGIRRQLPAASARDIRLFHWLHRISGPKGTAREKQAAALSEQALESELMVYQGQETETYAAQQPDGWSAEAAALVQQSPPDASMWIRERLTKQMSPAVQITRSVPTAQSHSQTGRGRTVSASSGREDKSFQAAPERLELAHVTQSQPPAAADKPTVRGSMDSDYVRGLPDWARRFLQEGAPQTREEAVRKMGTAQKLGTARSIAALPLPDGEAVEWTAPDYRAPAPTEYREPAGQQEQFQNRSVHISDAEIQRTADRVYRMIEDRIRRERHRLGL